MPSKLEAISDQERADNVRAAWQAAFSLILLTFVTYAVNVVINLLLLRWSAGNLSDEAALRHAIYFDKTIWNPNSVLLMLGILVIVVASAVIQYISDARYRRRQAQQDKLSSEINSLTAQIRNLDAPINAYRDKYRRLTPQWVSAAFARLRGRDFIPRPQPTAKERERYNKNSKRRKQLRGHLWDLEAEQQATNMADTEMHYRQIVKWFEEDKKLLDLTANFVRQRTWGSAAARTVGLLVVTTVASRILVGVLG